MGEIRRRSRGRGMLLEGLIILLYSMEHAVEPCMNRTYSHSTAIITMQRLWSGRGWVSTALAHRPNVMLPVSPWSSHICPPMSASKGLIFSEA